MIHSHPLLSFHLSWPCVGDWWDGGL